MSRFTRTFALLISLFALFAIWDSPAVGQTPQKGDPAYPAAFDKAYCLHQDPAIRELLQGASNGATCGDYQATQSKQPTPSWAAYTIQEPRADRAFKLATQGLIVDVPIDIWGWDPYKVMQLREAYGYTWVPSALQAPLAIAPGLAQPGVAPYDPKNPPPGAVIVSTNIADFPPLTPPPPPPASLTVLVGGPVYDGSNFYYNVVGDNSPDGTKYSDGRGTFLKHVYITPFGKSVIWEKIG